VKCTPHGEGRGFDASRGSAADVATRDLVQRVRSECIHAAPRPARPRRMCRRRNSFSARRLRSLPRSRRCLRAGGRGGAAGVGLPAMRRAQAREPAALRADLAVRAKCTRVSPHNEEAGLGRDPRTVADGAQLDLRSASDAEGASATKRRAKLSGTRTQDCSTLNHDRAQRDSEARTGALRVTALALLFSFFHSARATRRRHKSHRSPTHHPPSPQVTPLSNAPPAVAASHTAPQRTTRRRRKSHRSPTHHPPSPQVTPLPNAPLAIAASHSAPQRTTRRRRESHRSPTHHPPWLQVTPLPAP
jgi:hypothetical protein